MLDSPSQTAQPSGSPHILSVTELTRTVRELVEGEIGEFWVEG